MEQRLIDANALKDARIECPEHISFFDFGEMVERFLQEVDEQPTVDAVPVVRCGECTFHNEINCPLYYRRNELSDDWFCADGERR